MKKRRVIETWPPADASRGLRMRRTAMDTRIYAEEFASMWRTGYADLIVILVDDELQRDNFSLPREQIMEMVRRYYTRLPMPDLNEPELLVRYWLAEGMSFTMVEENHQ